MITLILIAATLGQDSDYVPNYDPQPGERLVLGLDGLGSNIPIGSNYFTINEFWKFIQAKDGVGIKEMVSSGRGATVDAGTPILFVKKHEQYKDVDLAEVRILEGPYKDKAVFTFLICCQKLDPVKVRAREKAESDARVWAEAKAHRKPLDPKAIVADLNASIRRAKAETAKLNSYKAAQQKEKLMRQAIDSVCKKHLADLDEINAIATAAGVFVNFDGQRYDVAGNKIKK